MALVSDMIFSMLLVGSGLLAASTLGFAVAWIRARERAIRAEQHAASAPGSGETRIDHLEHAVESIAVEVERVAEGQRFVSTLLAERVEDAGARPARVATRP